MSVPIIIYYAHACDGRARSKNTVAGAESRLIIKVVIAGVVGDGAVASVRVS